MKTKVFFFSAVCSILVSCMQQEMDLVASVENRSDEESSEKPMQPGAYENYTQLMEILCGQTRREPNGEIETYAVCVKAYMINRRLGLTRY